MSILAAVFVLLFLYGCFANAHRQEHGRWPASCEPRRRQPSPAELIASLQPERERELEATLAAWDRAIEHEIAAADRLALARRQTAA